MKKIIVFVSIILFLFLTTISSWAITLEEMRTVSSISEEVLVSTLVPGVDYPVISQEEAEEIQGKEEKAWTIDFIIFVVDGQVYIVRI